MPKAPAEPTNLVLEQLRLMRAETAARFDKLDAEVGELKAKIGNVERDMRGFKLNTIAEIYKANLTVASFVDLERRVEALEKKTSGAP